MPNDRTIETRVENASDAKEGNLKITNKDTVKVDEIIEEEKSGVALQGDGLIMLKTKKGTKINKKKKGETLHAGDMDEKINDDSIFSMYDGIATLKEDQLSVGDWSFGVGS